MRTDRRVSFFFYLFSIILILVSGTRMVNYTSDLRFLKDYLLDWESAIAAGREASGRWPQFSGENRVEYMEAVVRMMSLKHIHVPVSNTSIAYAYDIEKFWRKDKRVFLLSSPGSVLLYRVPEETFERIDRFVDNVLDPDGGMLTGTPELDGKSYIVRWQL